LAIQKSKGEYISWLSHDDLYYPDKIQKQIKALSQKDEDERKNIILMSNYALIDEQSRIIHKMCFEKIHSYDDLQSPFYALLNGIVNGLTLLIPKRCFKETGYFDPALRATQDYALWFKMFPKYKIIFMNDLLAKTRLHGAQVTNKSTTFLENDTLWIDMVKNINDEQKIAISGSLIGFYQMVYEVVRGAKFVGAEKYFLRMINKIKNRDISKIKVSVIIPFGGDIGLTFRAVKSVLDQTHKNLEVVVVNDSSSTNIGSIGKLIEKDNRVKLVKNKRSKGASGVKNTGIDIADGEYIAFLDPNDLFLPDKITKQLEFMVRSGFLFSHTSYWLFFEDKRKHEIVNSGRGDNLYPNIISNCNIATSTVMLHTDLFKGKYKENRFLEDYSAGEDECLWIKISRIFPCMGLDEVLTEVRKHKNGVLNDEKKQIVVINNILDYVIDNFFDMNSLEYIYALNKSLVDKKFPDKNKKIRKYFEFGNLQVSDNDVIGNKFNGHDLHFYLREKDVNSYQLVWNKESSDIATFQIASEKEDRVKTYLSVQEIQKEYQLNTLLNPLAYDILYNKLFLDTDVVHFHLMHNNIFDIQLLPIMSRLKPIVWTLHDPWSLGGHCVHSYECDKWKDQCGDCCHLEAHFPLDKDNSALNFEIKKRAIQNSKFDVIVASKWMLKKVEQSPVFRGKKIHLIPFGINQEIFKPMIKDRAREKFDIPKDALVIVFRSAYTEFKGMDYIEYVLKNIKTNKKIYILAVGGNFEIKIKNITCINFGWVKDDEILSCIYNASDLFLAPSKADSFGLMAVEAMSCGVLPIVLDGTALPDTVNAPDCGVSVKIDKSEYLKTVEYFVNHDKERMERSKKCLEYAEKYYNKDRYVEKIINVYKGAIKKHHLNGEDRHLLKQLIKHMAFDPKTYDFKNKLVNVRSDIQSNSVFGKYLPTWVKRKIKDYILISFYKIDKVFPREIRRKVKRKLVRYNFVKKYLIK
jgi:glycosyltransferase involved in cell wall biosynthesis